MRERVPSLARRAMARRRSEDGGFELSTRARWIAGWVAALLLVTGIAFVVGWIGGEGDGTVITPSPSASTVVDAPEIAFGTAIDAVTGQVAAESATTVFAAGDDFAYSVRPAERPPERIYVEVLRADEASTSVQSPSPQLLPSDAEVIAFVVPVADLLDVFGPGQYQMRIFTDPDEPPIATGRFELRGDTAPAPSP